MTGVTCVRARVLFISVLCALVLFASSVLLPAATVRAEGETGTLKVAVLQDVPDLNIFNLASNSLWKAKILLWAFEGMAAVDKDGVPYPLLAESWDLDLETLSVEVSLRQGVFFHDGIELRADDVVFTYRSLREGTVYTSSLVSAFDQDGDGYLTAQEMEHAVQKTGEYSVVLNMAVPYGQFFLRTMAIPIIPQHLWRYHLTADGVVDVMWSSPSAMIGTGPFAYGGGVAGDYRLMTRNDGYWGKDFLTPAGYNTYPPYVGQMRFEVLYDIGSAVDALISGDVDLVSSAVPASMLPPLQDDPSVGIEYMADNGYFYLGFNEKLQPFGSISFRKAVAHLVDKDTIVDVYMGGLGVAGTTCLPPYWGDWHNEDVLGYEYDDPSDGSSTIPEDLLDSAGFIDCDGDGWRDLPDGTHMDRIVILTPPADYDPVRVRAGQMVAENLCAVGVEAEARPVDFDTLIAKFNSFEYQMLVSGWRLGSDPVGNVFDILGPLSASNLFGFWSLDNPNPYYADILGVSTLADAETQALADGVLELGVMARSTFDVAEQKALTREAQAVISDALPVDVLYYRVNAQAYSVDWTGWVPHMGELLNAFSLSELEWWGVPTLEGSVTVAKLRGSPAFSAARVNLTATYDGTWTGVVQNSGLRGLTVDVYDTSSGEAVKVSTTKLFMGSQPTGTFAVSSVPMTEGASYQIVLTPLGSEGGYATLDWCLDPS